MATAAHPGWAATGFTMTTGRPVLDRVLALGTRLMAQSPQGGAQPTPLAAVGDVPGASLSGPRFGVRGPAAVEKLTSAALDDNTAQELWAVSERLTQTQFRLPAA